MNLPSKTEDSLPSSAILSPERTIQEIPDSVRPVLPPSSRLVSINNVQEVTPFEKRVIAKTAVKGMGFRNFNQIEIYKSENPTSGHTLTVQKKGQSNELFRMVVNDQGNHAQVTIPPAISQGLPYNGRPIPANNELSINYQSSPGGRPVQVGDYTFNYREP